MRTTPYLFDPLLLKFRPKGHSQPGDLVFGGSRPDIIPDCPNCHEPFPHYLTIDPADERTPLPRSEPLPLFYCMECDGCNDTIAYRFTRGKVQMVAFGPGQSFKDNYRNVHNIPRLLPVRSVKTVAVTPEQLRLMLLLPTLSSGFPADDEGNSFEKEEAFFDAWDAAFNVKPDGMAWIGLNVLGGPCVSIQNHVLTECRACRETGGMRFLASIVGDPAGGVILPVMNYMQVAFWYCLECHAVNSVKALT